MEQAKNKLGWINPGTPTYLAAFQALEEQRTLQDSLLLSLRHFQESEDLSAVKEFSIADQVNNAVFQ